MLREKLANEIASAAREKLASWEKKWILNRRNQGLPEPTAAEYERLIRKERSRGTAPSTSFSGGTLVDPIKARDRIDSKLSRFSPDFLARHGNRVDALRNIHNPRYKRWAGGAQSDRYDRILAPSSTFGHDNQTLAEAMQYSGNLAREQKVVSDILGSEAQPLSRILKASPVKDKFVKAWGREGLLDNIRDGALFKPGSREAGLDIPKIIANRFETQGQRNPSVFFSGEYPVSAGYAAPGKLFQIGDYRHIIKNDPWASYSQHLAEAAPLDRLRARLRKDVYLAGNKELSQLHKYEGVTQLSNILADPNSSYYMVTDRPMGKFGPQQLLNKTKVAPMTSVQKHAPALQKALRALIKKPLRF